MEDILVRIDDRLIHGQVVEAWIPHLRADMVVVVSDAAARDATQGALMRLALPDAVELKILGYKDAAAFLQTADLLGRKVLVLAPGPLEILGLLDEGARLKKVNVGGLHHSAGTLQIGRQIFLSELDREALREIARRGVSIEGRALPGEAPMDVLAAVGGGAA